LTSDSDCWTWNSVPALLAESQLCKRQPRLEFVNPRFERHRINREQDCSGIDPVVGLGLDRNYAATDLRRDLDDPAGNRALHARRCQSLQADEKCGEDNDADEHSEALRDLIPRQ
jgi:hypothetical protein